MEFTTTLPWVTVPAILAVAQTGSLSAAARKLGQSQPTLGRHIQAAEAALGGRLFDRHPKGLAPTARLRALLPMAEQMREAARAMELQAAGESEDLSGAVRVTASVVVSTFLLPSILAQFRSDYPEIAIDLVPSDTTQNLLFHEADIAVRMYRPSQLDMITRYLGELPLALYAAPAYIARRGAPQTPEELFDHELIGYDRDDRLVKGFRERGFPITRETFALRCDDQVAYWSLVRAGAGIGIGQSAVAAQAPDLVPVLPGLPLPALPVWLTAHERLRHVPRVDAVWTALAQGLLRACLDPPAAAD